MTASKVRIAHEPDDDAPPTVGEQWESAKDIKRRPLLWMLPNRIPAASVVLVEGDKGVGKSTLLCALAAHVTGGRKLVGRKKPAAGSVLWCPGEEDASTVTKSRLEAAGANMDRVHFPRENERGERRKVMLPSGTGQLRSAVDHFGATLLVIDPLSAHVPPEVSLSFDQDIHSVLDPLAELAHATGCTVVCTRNLTKNTQGPALHRGLGGAAVAGVARALLRIDWPDEKSTRRLMRVVRCNSGRPVGPLEYELAEAGDVCCLARVRELGVDQDDADATADDPGERDVRADARLLLRRVLDAGRVSVKVIEAEAKAACIGDRTLRFAKADLKVQSHRVSNANPPHWEWGPPKGGWK
jgi:putative DNA primase/helicase